MENAKIKVSLSADEIAALLTVGSVMIRMLDASKEYLDAQRLDDQEEIDRIANAGDAKQ